jgi:hypothetical protein
LQPPALIPGKFQQEFPFVASMGNMPYIAGKEVAISPWHFYRLRRMILGSKMPFEDPKKHLLTGLSFAVSISWTGPILNSKHRKKWSGLGGR